MRQTVTHHYRGFQKGRTFCKSGILQPARVSRFLDVHIPEAVPGFLRPYNGNAKIWSKLNFDLEYPDMRTMTKCPRCNIEQEESSQCAYCGLVFEASVDATRAAKGVHLKVPLLVAVILVVAGALLAAYLFVSYRDKPGVIASDAGRSSDFVQRTGEKDLKTVARELSGDVGILNDITSGYTPGSIIAMVIFSIIGLGYFAYGKKSRQFLMLICGIALMGYSYFVDGMGHIILIGVGLGVLPFILGRK